MILAIIFEYSEFFLPPPLDPPLCMKPIDSDVVFISFFYVDFKNSTLDFWFFLIMGKDKSFIDNEVSDYAHEHEMRALS